MLSHNAGHYLFCYGSEHARYRVNPALGIPQRFVRSRKKQGNVLLVVRYPALRQKSAMIQRLHPLEL